MNVKMIGKLLNETINEKKANANIISTVVSDSDICDKIKQS